MLQTASARHIWRDAWEKHLTLCWHCRMGTANTAALFVKSTIEINPFQAICWDYAQGHVLWNDKNIIRAIRYVRDKQTTPAGNNTTRQGVRPQPNKELTASRR